VAVVVGPRGRRGGRKKRVLRQANDKVGTRHRSKRRPRAEHPFNDLRASQEKGGSHTGEEKGRENFFQRVDFDTRQTNVGDGRLGCLLAEARK